MDSRRIHSLTRTMHSMRTIGWKIQNTWRLSQKCFCGQEKINEWVENEDEDADSKTNKMLACLNGYWIDSHRKKNTSRLCDTDDEDDDDNNNSENDDRK